MKFKITEHGPRLTREELASLRKSVLIERDLARHDKVMRYLISCGYQRDEASRIAYLFVKFENEYPKGK